MLVKTDIKQIKNIVGELLADFFHGTLAPYLEEKFDQNDQDHEKMFRTLDRNRDEHDKIFQDEDKLEKRMKNHENRLNRLETTPIS